MVVCDTCGNDYSVEGELLNIDGQKLIICPSCASARKLNPVEFERNIKRSRMQEYPDWPVCDACGKRHSDQCSTINFAGENFNVCGQCIPEVQENPADFLAGKKGTEPEA